MPKSGPCFRNHIAVLMERRGIHDQIGSYPSFLFAVQTTGELVRASCSVRGVKNPGREEPRKTRAHTSEPSITLPAHKPNPHKARVAYAGLQYGYDIG